MDRDLDLTSEPSDLFEFVFRRYEVQRLRETYSDRYLLETGLCTSEELRG